MIRKRLEDIKIKKKEKPNYVFNNKIDVRELSHVNKPINRRLSKTPKIENNKKRYSNFILILFLLSLLIGIVFWSSVIFENVSISITRKHQIFNLNNQVFSATKGLNSEIPFEIMIQSDTQNEKISLSSSNKVSAKAKGEATIYNKYSKTSEKIPIHTYLSDENGKVYLTNNNIVIPGYTTKSGNIIPGQASVGITSFLPGEVYNGSPTNFYINAFKGTSKYNKIYGKAKTTMTGGALGTYYSLSNNDKKLLKNKINLSLRKELIQKVNPLIPSDYIFYPEASSFSFNINENILSPTKEVSIPVYGTLNAILLNKNKLNNFILKDLLPNTSAKELSIINLSGLNKLSFSSVNQNEVINKNLQSIKFKLNGSLDLTWNPNLSSLKNKLLGVSKNNLQSIFKKDVGIDNAGIKIFPPWQSTLPFNSSDIKINFISN